ncbi:MAG: AtpZ/AtpI family protein [Ruminococcaceae bacterium]|nr:AtpZ/AtpI family protein [Oscillospiraceae bacterium]
MKNSYQKLITPLYVLNIVLQALISLLSPIAVMFLLAWLLVTKLAVGTWIYVVLIMIGVFSGLYSMVVFIISASRALEAIEKQNSQKKEDKSSKNE